MKTNLFEITPSGSQPLTTDSGLCFVVCVGEIII